MKTHKGKQYIMSDNWEHIRQLYLHQNREKKSQEEILSEVMKEIDDFLEGNTKRVFCFIMPDGSPTFTITPLVKHNLQERRKAKRRKR